MNEQPKQELILAPKVGRLNRLPSIRKEMARVYAEARKGDIEVGTGSKLIYMLKQIGDLVKDQEIDKIAERLEALEDAQ